MASKTIVVVGGTGRVVKAAVASFIQNPGFHVKVTTRNVESDKAKYVKSLGAEVVKADSWVAAELDAAIAGAWGLFLNTDSEAADFVGDTGLTETQMGKKVVDAARRQGVEHFVFASLPEAFKVTNGAVQISTFFHKNNISKYATDSGFKTASNVNVGWMMENFWNPVYEKPFGGFARRPDAHDYLTIITTRLKPNLIAYRLRCLIHESARFSSPIS